MRYLLILLILLTNTAYGQGLSLFGVTNPSRTTDTSKTWGILKLPNVPAGVIGDRFLIQSSDGQVKFGNDGNFFKHTSDSTNGDGYGTRRYIDSLVAALSGGQTWDATMALDSATNHSAFIKVPDTQITKRIFYYGTSITAGLGAGFVNSAQRALYRYSFLLSQFTKTSATNKAVNGQFLKRYGVISSPTIPTFFDSIASYTWIPIFDSAIHSAAIVELGFNEYLCNDTGYTAAHLSQDMRIAIDTFISRGWAGHLIWETMPYQKGYYTVFYPTLPAPNLARENEFNDTIRAVVVAKDIRLFDANAVMAANVGGLLINSGEDVHFGADGHQLYAYGLLPVITQTVKRDPVTPQALAVNGTVQAADVIFSTDDMIMNRSKAYDLFVDSLLRLRMGVNMNIRNSFGQIQSQSASFWIKGIGKAAYFESDSISNGSITDSAVVWSTATKRFYKVSPSATKVYVDSLFATIPIVDTSSLSSRIDTNEANIAGIPAPIMKNKTIIRLNYTTPGVSTYNLYTPPAGKRAALYNLNAFDYPNLGSSIRYHIKNSSGDFILVTNVNIAAAGTGQAASVAAYIMEYGDTLQIETLTANLNVFGVIMLFDTAGSNVRTVKAMNLTTGNNTVYTCPVGKNSVILGVSLLPTIQSGLLNFGSDAGGTRTYYFNNVPNGGSPASTNQVSKATGLLLSRRSLDAFGTALTAGDYINVNVDAGATNEWAFVSVIEW